MFPTSSPLRTRSIRFPSSPAAWLQAIPCTARPTTRGHTTKTELTEQICSLLGGRVAEKLTQDDITTGASNDIQRATEIAQKMVMKYGMSEKLGPIVYGKDHDEVFLGRDLGTTQTYSDEIASEIDEEVKSIVEGQFEHAQKILTEHMNKLHEIAKYLFENEKMDADCFKAAMAAE